MAAREDPGKARRGVFPTILDQTHAVPMTQPFWDAAREDRLVAPRCTNCGTFRLPPAPFCWICQSREVAWVELPGTGTVYTYTVVRHPLHPDLAEVVPYISGLVELDGTQGAGARMLANIIDCDPDRIRIGTRVRIVFDHVNEEMSTPRFRPIDEQKRELIRAMADQSLEALWSRTVWQTLVAGAERFPDKDAIVAATDAGEVQRVTWRALVERAANLSAGLAGIGVRRGDRVALWMTNTIEWVVSAYAAMRIGAAIVPINTFLRPVEVKYFLAQSGARHLLMIDAFRQLRFPDMLAEICPEFAPGVQPGCLYGDELPELRNVVVVHRSGGGPDVAIDFASLEADGRDSLAARQLADRMEQAVEGRDLAMVKYTSGSTGWPKGAMLEQGGMIANAILHAKRWEISETDVWFSMMPLFHAGGSIQGLFTMLVSGGTLVFTEAVNVDQAMQLLASERATVFFGLHQNDVIAAALPTGRAFPSLWFGTKGSEDARKVFPNVRYQMSPYGLTEGYAVVAMTSPSDPPEKQATTAGRIIEGDECRIIDPPTGLDAAPGEIGEAWIRGMVMRGYWNKPEESARAIDNDGWLHTEDLLSRDDDGYVTYHGRLKLMLKVGGENVSIEEVERTVASHEAIAECAAVGVPDRKYTEVVRAYVVLAANHALEEDALRDWLKARLAQFKRPRDIIFLDELPKLGNGKLDRVTLAALADQATVSS